MKAFHFRLQRVLDWREVERRLTLSRVEAAAATLSRVSAERATIHDALARGPEGCDDGVSLANWNGWKATLVRHLRSADVRMSGAQAAAQLLRKALLEADRKVKLLDKLRQGEIAQWRSGLEREMSAQATELYLIGLARGLRAKQVTIEASGRVAQVDRAPAF